MIEPSIVLFLVVSDATRNQTAAVLGPRPFHSSVIPPSPLHKVSAITIRIAQAGRRVSGSSIAGRADISAEFFSSISSQRSGCEPVRSGVSAILQSAFPPSIWAACCAATQVRPMGRAFFDSGVSIHSSAHREQDAVVYEMQQSRGVMARAISCSAAAQRICSKMKTAIWNLRSRGTALASAPFCAPLAAVPARQKQACRGVIRKIGKTSPCNVFRQPVAVCVLRATVGQIARGSFCERCATLKNMLAISMS